MGRIPVRDRRSGNELEAAPTGEAGEGTSLRRERAHRLFACRVDIEDPVHAHQLEHRAYEMNAPSPAVRRLASSDNWPAVTAVTRNATSAIQFCGSAIVSV